MHAGNPLVTPALDAPSGVNLMWNTSMPLAAAVLSPVTALAGPVVSYVLLVTVAPALDAWCAFLALRRLVPGTAAAASGALLFGFSPFVLAQSLSHAHVTLLASAPLLLLALHSLFVRRSAPLRTGALLGLVAAAQLLVGEEMLVIEAVTAALALGVAAAVWRDAIHELVRPGLVALAAAAAAFAVLAAVPLGVQLFGPQHPSGQPESPDVFVTDAANLVLPTSIQAVAPQAAVREYQDRIGRNTAEEGGYLGVPLLVVCAAAGIVWRHRRVVVWASASGLAVTLLALGAHLRVDGHQLGGVPMPWRPFQSIPILSDVLPGRFMAMAFGFASVLVAVAVAELAVERRPAPRVAWSAGLAAIVVALAPALPYPAESWTVPSYFRSAASTRIPDGSLVLLAPFPSPLAAQTMVWQAAAGMRFDIVGGYAYHPDPAGRFTLEPDRSATRRVMEDVEAGGPPRRGSEDLASMTDELRRWGVGSVVVGPDPAHEAFVGLFEQLLGRAPDAVGEGVAAWYGVAARLGPGA